MQSLVETLIPFALAAVVLVLLFRLWNMMRGSSLKLSQILMRWRVMFQLIAVCLVMAAMLFAR